MNIIKNTAALCMMLMVTVSCSTNTSDVNLKAEFAKGTIELSCECDTTNWKKSLPADEGLSLCFGNKGMAIFTNGSKKVILPKKDKSCYSYGEIIEEFKRSDDEVTQDYFSYYLKTLKKVKKEEDVHAMVSRGGPVTMISPGESCAMWKDTVTFEWHTSLQTSDSIAFMLWKEGDTLVYQDTIPAVPSVLKLYKANYGLENGAAFTWAAFMTGMPMPETKNFKMADAEALAKYQDEISQTKNKLSGYPDYVTDNLIAAKSEAGGFCY